MKVEISDKELCLICELMQLAYKKRLLDLKYRKLWNRLEKILHDKTDIIPSYIGCA